MTGEWSANPYVGLRPFDRDDSLYFFGRGAQTTQLLEILHRTRFLPVVGSSGSGKSSLVRAGLIPKLLGGFLVEERDRWRVASMRPGGAPHGNLAWALQSAFNLDGSSNAFEQSLREGHTDAAAKFIEQHLGPNENLLLLVDQFEEVFAFRGHTQDDAADADPARRKERAQRREEAADFVDLLLALSERRELPIYVVLTMRTDFLGDCDVFYGLPEAMNLSQYLIPRLSRQQLREAIEGPALLMRAGVAARLLDKLLNDLGDRFDRLPVLQHALMRTWDAWERDGKIGPVDLQHFREAGELDGALSQDAQMALHEALTGPDAVSDPNVVTMIFKQLTDTDVSLRRVRRPVRLSELAAVAAVPVDTVRWVVECFRGSGRNFLTESADGSAINPRIDISHESLIRQWDQLRNWVDEEREARNRFIELLQQARRWELGKAALLQQPDLGIALQWLSTVRLDGKWADRYSQYKGDAALVGRYVKQSEDEALQVVAAKRVKRRREVMFLGGFSLVVTVLALVAALAWSRAKVDRDAAETARHIADSAKSAAVAAKDVAQQAEVAAQRSARVAQLLQVTADSMSHDAITERGHAEIERENAARVNRASLTREYGIQDPATASLVAAEMKPGPRYDFSRIALLRRVAERPVPVAVFTRITAAALNESGTSIALGFPDGSIHVQRADGTGPFVELKADTSAIDEVRFAANGKRIISASHNGWIRQWKLDDPSKPASFHVLQGALRGAGLTPGSSDLAIRQLDVSDDGRHVVGVTRGNWMFAWNPDVPNAEPFMRPGATTAAVGHRLGSRLAWDERAGAMSSMSTDARNHRVLDTDFKNKEVLSIGFSGDESCVFDAGPYTMSVYRFVDSARTDTLKLGNYRSANSAALDGNCGRLLLGYNNSATVYKIGGGDSIPLVGHTGTVTHVSFSPDGKQVLTASSDNTARVWTLDPPRTSLILRGHRFAIKSAAFSANGSKVLTVGNDSTARVWEAPFVRDPTAI
ncbi:MAG: hypothetical protein ABI625_09230, partial [bacterium]